MLSGQDARSEAGVVAKIADFVSDHGTSGDPNIKLVSLSKTGISSVHSFKSLKRKLIANDIDLTCKYRQGESKVKKQPRPELRIYDKNGAGSLIYIRYSSTEDEVKIWNTVEMKELLKKLTTITHAKKVKDETGEQDAVKIQDQDQDQNQEQQVPINIIDGIIARHQLPIDQKPQIMARANELLKAGYNFNQIEQELVKQFTQQQPVNPAPVPAPSQDTVQPAQQTASVPQQPVFEELFSILKNAGMKSTQLG
jgi:hypothetical protein